MGYPDPLKASIRKLTDDCVTIACPFGLLGLNIGARMSIFNFDRNLVIWSPIPYNKEIFNLAVKLLVGDADYQVKYVIVPNNEHNMFAHQYKEQFSDTKVIAGEKVKLKNGCQIDHKITADLQNQVISGSDWVEKLGVSDSFFANNFEMICLKNHFTNDISLFDKATKTLYVADLVANLGAPGTTSGEVQLEQYSEACGYQKGFKPHGGFSFFTRYTQPNSVVSQWMAWLCSGTRLPEGKEAIKKIYNWDFERIVVIHGNVIENDAKNQFKKLFYSCFQEK